MKEQTTFELLESIRYRVLCMTHYAIEFGRNGYDEDRKKWVEHKEAYKKILDELEERAGNIELRKINGANGTANIETI